MLCALKSFFLCCICSFIFILFFLVECYCLSLLLLYKNAFWFVMGSKSDDYFINTKPQYFFRHWRITLCITIKIHKFEWNTITAIGLIIIYEISCKWTAIIWFLYHFYQYSIPANTIVELTKFVEWFKFIFTCSKKLNIFK